MKLLLSLLVLALGCVSAAKRHATSCQSTQRTHTYSSELAASGVVTRQRAKEISRIFEETVLVDDIVFSFLKHVFPDEIVPDFVTLHPLWQYTLVCKQWCDIIRSPLFRGHLERQPHFARFVLMRAPALYSERHYRLLEVAKYVLSSKDRVDLLIRVYNTSFFRLLTGPERIELINKEEYESYYEGFGQNILKAFPSPKALNNVEGSKKVKSALKKIYAADYTKPFAQQSIFICPRPIWIIALMLDELIDPSRYCWICPRVMLAISWSYFRFQDSRGQLSDWLKPLHQIRLPLKRRPLLWNILEWPLLLAALSGEWGFFDLTGMDIEKDAHLFNPTDYLPCLFRDLIAAKEFPEGHIHLSENALDSFCTVIEDYHVYCLFEFDRGKIRESIERFSPPITDESTLDYLEDLFQE